MPTSRRSVLQTIASAAVAAPMAAQHVHQAANDLVQINNAAYKPKFFSREEFDTVRVLVDLIIPRTDTPGATDAGVHRIIDADVSKRPPVQKLWRNGLTWLRSETAGKPFTSLPQTEQIEILRRASQSVDTPAARFFTLLKASVVDFYYTTKEGLREELGWNANTYLPEFKGCTHKEHQG